MGLTLNNNNNNNTVADTDTAVSKPTKRVCVNDPVIGQEPKTASKTKNPNKRSNTTAVPRSPKDWDKFDLDQALESSDSDSENSNSQTDEKDKKLKLENSKKAINFKNKGNTALQKGDSKSIQEAINFYTKGIELDEENAALFANRGWSYYKLNKYFEAEKDYSMALTIDPVYFKVIKRRAQVRLDLNKIASARSDIERALKLSPQDKEAKKLLESLDRPKITSSKEKEGVKQPFKEIKKPQHIKIDNYKMHEIPILNGDKQDKPIMIETKSRIIDKPQKEKKEHEQPKDQKNEEPKPENKIKPKPIISTNQSDPQIIHKKSKDDIKIDAQLAVLESVSADLDQARQALNDAKNIDSQKESLDKLGKCLEKAKIVKREKISSVNDNKSVEDQVFPVQCEPAAKSSSEFFNRLRFWVGVEMRRARQVQYN